MKTKPFLLATAGATVDGRTIDENMLVEMAATYEPATYGARLNIEHIRGLSGDGPFRAFGDVVELSVGDVELQIGGETEKRKGLYGVLDINDDAKALNDAGQKVYPSIEIQPNFANTGKAYLMGVALTDSPASIGTERMAFNRALPGSLKVNTDAPELSFAIEFAEDKCDVSEGGEKFISGFGAMLEKVFGKQEPKKTEPDTPAPAGDAPADFSALKPMFEGLAENFATAITGLETKIADQSDQFALKVKALDDKIENTPVDQYTQRPAASGPQGDKTKTDC